MSIYIADLHAEYAKYVTSMEEYMESRQGSQSDFTITPFSRWVNSKLAYGASWVTSDDTFYDFDLVYRVSCP